MHIAFDGELKDKSEVEFTVRPSGQPSVEISARFSSEDLQQLQQCTSWLRSDYTAPCGKQASSLKAIGLFLILFGVGCELLHNRRTVVQSKPILQLNVTKFSGRNLWQLLKDFAALDEEIAYFEGTCLAESTDSPGFYVRQASEAWTRIAEATTFVQRLNPARRMAAQLYSYGFWSGEGIVQLTFPHSGESSFRRQKVYLSGYLVKGSDAKRPVRVDMAGARRKEIYSVLAPSEHFRDLPHSDRRFSPARIASWMQAHRALRILMLTAVGLGLPYIVVWVLSTLYQIQVHPTCAASASILGILALNLGANGIQAFLATMYPEDAQLVE